MSKESAISLAVLQSNLEKAASCLRTAQKEKAKADLAFAIALEAKEVADVEFNAGAAQLKAATKVANIYAA